MIMNKCFLGIIIFISLIILIACEIPTDPEDEKNDDEVIELNWIVYTYSQEVWYTSNFKNQFPDINKQNECDKIELYLNDFFIKFQINDTTYVKTFTLPDYLYWSEKQ